MGWLEYVKVMVSQGFLGRREEKGGRRGRTFRPRSVWKISITLLTNGIATKPILIIICFPTLTAFFWAPIACIYT